jgi:5-methylcytosine-specific restriction endonuclease McrA
MPHYRKEPEHATRSGYAWHRRDMKEEPCQPCTDAERAYWKHQRVIRKDQINQLRRLSRERRKYTHQSRRTRARKIGVEYGYYTDQDVLDLYGSVCHICNEDIDLNAPRKCGDAGWEKGLHIDHVYPISRGGSDTLENVRPSHGRCNVIKWATIG